MASRAKSPALVLVALMPLSVAWSVQVEAQPFVIPVVVHVLHNNGIENITSAQVANGLEILNTAFNGGFNEPVVAAYTALQANMQVQFCFASIAPDGTPTTGIEWIDVGPDFIGGGPGTYVDQWPPERYLNIWIVPFVDVDLYSQGALRPDQAEQEPERDGIMIMHTMFGSIGTGTPIHSRGICLMAGRYLDLKLLWEDPTGTGDCGDDGVSDTPPTAPFTICFPNLMSCVAGTPTNVENYMTYSYCNKMFTLGQRDRVYNALQSPTAQRNNLWTPANLALTGCGIATDVSDRSTVDELMTYPNPAINQVDLTGLTQGPCSVELMDATGRIVVKSTHMVDSNGHLVIELPSGTTSQMLHLRASQNGRTRSKKFVVEAGL
jgi:hypothetical protein